MEVLPNDIRLAAAREIVEYGTADLKALAQDPEIAMLLLEGM
jgi:hypothetical protein